MNKYLGNDQLSDVIANVVTITGVPVSGSLFNKFFNIF